LNSDFSFGSEHHEYFSSRSDHQYDFYNVTTTNPWKQTDELTLGNKLETNEMQILAIPGSCMSWNNASNGISVWLGNWLAIHFVRHKDISKRINGFVKWKRATILVANLVLIVAQETNVDSL